MTTPAAVTEYVIRVPKNQKKKYQVMRFNSSLNIDFQKWTQVKMERENNMREFKGPDEEQPKYGAGSEFGRDAREEARRKKFGIVSRKYKPDDQPWLMKVKQAGKNSSYKGVREGGIAENAAYYVFTHAPDGAIDAYPLQEWYNFQPIHRYKALSAEEAEEEFGRRNKLMNYFSLMTRKRCRGKDDDAELDDPDEAKLKKGGIKKKELKISDMDDWVNSSDEDETESETEGKDKEEAKEEKDKKKKQKEKDKNKTKKKKKKDYDSEAFEESDDGDEEGREVDYISDSSDSESDHEGKANKELKSVAEEDALRKLLSSGSSDEDEDNKDKEKEESEKEEEKTKEGGGGGGGGGGAAGDKPSPNKDESGGAKKIKKKKKKRKKSDVKAAKREEAVKRASSSDFSSDSATDSESEAKRKFKKEGGSRSFKDAVRESKDVKDLREKDAKDSASGGSSRSGTPTKEVSDNKRKMSSTPEPLLGKKMRLDNFASAPYSSSPTINSESGITEDAVRRYLMRKPMTTTELLQKFKSKKTGLNSDQLVNIMTQILKRINPVKQTIKGKMYLSIKH